MPTEFNDATHYGIFLSGTTLTSQTGNYVRESELVLAALRAQGVFDIMEDGTTAPAVDKLWLDKNTDPAILKEWDSVSSTWQAMTFDRLFGRATVTDLVNLGGTANAITADEPAPFTDGKIYGVVPLASNTGATTIQITGVGTYDVVYPDGSDIAAGELSTDLRTPLLFANGRFEVLFGSNAGSIKRAETDASGFGFVLADDDTLAGASAKKLALSKNVKAYADTGRLTENLSYSPSFNLTRVRSVQERLSEGVYLDDFLGATDTDKFLDFAANSDERFIRIPGRVVNIDATIEGTDKYWHIKGAGPGASTIQYNGTADDVTPVFKFIRDGSDIKSFYQISDLKFNVENAYSGIPVWIEEQRPTGADQVVGGIDLLYIDNVICDADGSGYWARFVHSENAGGISVKRFQARNNGSSTAQADTRTKGLYFNNSQSNIFCIRTLQMCQFNLGRIYNAIELNIANSIESLYLSEFEIVGAHDGIFAYGTGKLGATRLGGGHMDILRSGIFANPSGGMNYVRLNGADIRRSNNGGDYEAGDCVHLAGNSRYLAVTGCTFTGNRSTNTGMAQSGILFSGQAAGAIAGNTYIDLQYGNQFGNAVSDIQVGVNSYYEVEQDNTVSSTSSDSINIVPRYRGKRALVTRTTDQSIANNTASAIGWNSQVFDDVGLFTLASNSIFTIPAGVSRVKLRASVWMAAASSGALTLQVLKNGAAVLGGAYRQIDLASATNDAIAIETAGISCAETDTFSVQITQTSGGALAVKGTGDAGLHSWFEIEVLA